MMVKQASFRLLGFAAAGAVVLAAAFLPLARSRIQATPSYTPIGVASSGDSSMAWFYDPASARALACQSIVTQNAGLSSIRCVATKLP
jgi:hypothetical protein